MQFGWRSSLPLTHPLSPWPSTVRGRASLVSGFTILLLLLRRHIWMGRGGRQATRPIIALVHYPAILPGNRAWRPAWLKYYLAWPTGPTRYEDRNRSRSRSFSKIGSRSIDVGKSEIVTALVFSFYKWWTRNFLPVNCVCCLICCNSFCIKWIMCMDDVCSGRSDRGSNTISILEAWWRHDTWYVCFHDPNNNSYLYRYP